MATAAPIQDHALYTDNTTTAQQYNPSSYNNNSNNVNTHGMDLERLNTIATLLGPSGGELAVEPRRRSKNPLNPSPLGLCAFALTTMVLSLVNVRARHVEGNAIVVGLAFGYGGLVQIIAGIFEGVVGNSFAFTALTSYGGFWLSFGFLIYSKLGIEAAYTMESELGAAVGIYLICWAIFTTLLLLCTLKSTIAFFLLFFTLDMAFILLAIGFFRIANDNFVPLIKAGGYFGIMAASLAFYNALAGLVEKHNSFFAIPTMPFPWSEAGRAGRSSHHDKLRDEKSS